MAVASKALPGLVLAQQGQNQGLLKGRGDGPTLLYHLIASTASTRLNKDRLLKLLIGTLGLIITGYHRQRWKKQNQRDQHAVTFVKVVSTATLW